MTGLYGLLTYRMYISLLVQETETPELYDIRLGSGVLLEEDGAPC